MALKTKQKGAICVELFPEVNVNETCDRVHKFLTADLDKLLRLSGRSLTDLKSPALSLTSGRSDNGNSIENSLVRGLDAEIEIQAIYNSINSLQNISKIILQELYIKRTPSWKVVNMVSYEQSRFYDLRRKALIEFADCFDYQQRVLKCTPIIDLHVYKQS